MYVCVRALVGYEEVNASVEFGELYINQFHYHRDQGVSKFPLKATSQEGGHAAGQGVTR